MNRRKTSEPVADPVEGVSDACSHIITFDGSILPSGIYLYQLEAGAYSAMGKMVLVK